MSLSPKLQLRQTQSLVMTPQLLQSIRLLQLTHTELEQFIASEIESNPLLERDERGDREAEMELEGTGGEYDALPYSAASMAERLDSSLENLFPDDPGVQETIGPDLSAQWRSAAGNGIAAAGNDDFNLEAVAAAPVTLREHLREQIAFAFHDPASRILAEALTEELDEAGYLAADLDEIALRAGADRAMLDRVLETCRTFDPPGLFARDLADCLALQLKARDRLDPAMQALLSHLDLLARRDFRTLKRLCGVDEEDLVDMLAEIRTLDPRPGAAFTSGTADPIVPDVIVRRSADGSWAVELNPEALPRVLVDETYFATVSARARGEEKLFLSECLQNANWLVRSLDQRARTILKVTSEIVRRQDAFLTHGVRHLRPLKLRDVAEAIGMHESTVSRVAANKYMMTPRGVFELRYFFTTAIAAADGGDAHSAEAVRDRIRDLIEAEDASSVLSDDAIVELLRSEGVDIARRTVAKYRESMNIPSSVQRRREKKAMAGAVA
ncbi:RNA polymerase factor sigma-54 [Chelativorans sp. SCAU2101]|uniref:RNA polymerase sigma-54 factor n=1 Tax=Chelativorans petroleitrophicus TaxID=2975484 RepID=A0A9X3B988_9HYPH|nr:RNA polymerase factor sigma-54 [Chelativorans petroleitrophicus]MCT8989991.1 RNA polymerase factor sigma-54 [Chelativorans petroleitrophicus]